MEDDDERWISYEEFSHIKDRVKLSITDYDLEVTLYINNQYPDYYPLEFTLSDELVAEILSFLEKTSLSQSSPNCEAFFSVYNDLQIIDDTIFASFYNYELENSHQITTIPFYSPPKPLSFEDNRVADLHIHISNDIPLYLKDFIRIQANEPHTLSYSITNGPLAEKNLSALITYCNLHNISLQKKSSPSEVFSINETELIQIALTDLRLSHFNSFRQLQFYKNPDISNEVIELSQSHLIQEIIIQAEQAYSPTPNYRDIFITAPTGAGKSLLFQIPAVYLAKKHHKLTIVIEPVKALMQDQKDHLTSRGFTRVETFNSDLSSQAEKEAVLRRVKSGDVDLLYLSPETLLSYSMETLIGDREIGLLIVDEAHIVTTWGVGFRPDYWYLGSYIHKLRNKTQVKRGDNRYYASFPICAFTATAVNGGIDDTIGDTIISLYMENPIKHIGYVRRDNIHFDIAVRNSSKISSPIYENQKASNFISRVNTWITSNQKTIAYFPYAAYAVDAYRGIKSFSKKEYPRDHVAIYTGKNLFDVSNDEHSKMKKQAFDDFRSGVKPVMFTTKAFGMGVDISDITNVYHYAVSGGICDYIQEIGRVARKKDSIGYAIVDYYANDLSFMQKLYGMSQIRQYQINLVLSGIYNTYRSKNNHRNFLITPESFTYIFSGKDVTNDTDSQINKLKTCLLMLEKDLYDKYNFKVLIARPQSIFTKAYVCISKEQESLVLHSPYGKHFSFIAHGRVRQQENHTLVSDVGDIFSLDLKAVWEEHYPNMSFPEFKYWYFNRNTNSKKKIDIMPTIRNYFYIRQLINVETKGDFHLCDIQQTILEDLTFISDNLYSNYRNCYFTIEDFENLLKQKYGKNKAKIISNALLHLVDPKNTCIKRRDSENHITTYYLSNGTFGTLLTRAITKSSLIKSWGNNPNIFFSKYMALAPDGSDALALKLLSIFDYITYEASGGEQPEIFIRLNDPEKIRQIVYNEIKYSNSYVTKARQKHERDVRILQTFLSTPLSDNERWDFIERYFLGYDVLDSQF